MYSVRHLSATLNTTPQERGRSHPHQAQRLQGPQPKPLLLAQKVSQICKYLLLILLFSLLTGHKSFSWAHSNKTLTGLPSSVYSLAHSQRRLLLFP